MATTKKAAPKKPTAPVHHDHAAPVIKKTAHRKPAAHAPTAHVPAAHRPVKPAVQQQITLQQTVDEKIESLKINGLMSQVGLKIAAKHIIADCVAGHIDTDLTGKPLEVEVNKMLCVK